MKSVQLMEFKSQQQLTENQEITLKQFRDYVRNKKFNDNYLMRFLNSRNYDLELTKQRWETFIKWREENDIDNIKEFEFQEIDQVRQFYPHGYAGVDKLGRPVYIEQIGKINVKGLFEITTNERMITYLTQGYEYLINVIYPACSQAKGQLIDKSIVILDLKGVQLSMLPKVKKFIEMCSAIGRDYYPECLGVMFIINAPMLFAGIWAGIKIFLDANTQKKIKILGSGYKKELLEYIDEEQLPSILGGKGQWDLSKNFGPWNPNGLEIYGSKSDIYEKNKEFIPSPQEQVQRNQSFQSSYGKSVLDEDFHSVMDDELSQIDNSQFSFSQQKNKNQDHNEIQTQNILENIQPLDKPRFSIRNSGIELAKSEQVKIQLLEDNLSALQVYIQHHKNQQKTYADQNMVMELFQQQRIYLNPENVNYVAKSYNPLIIEFELSSHRYLQLIAFGLLQFALVILQNSLLSNQVEISKQYNCEVNKVNLANLFYILYYGFFQFFMCYFSNKVVYLHILSGIALSITGAWLKIQNDNIYYIFVGQSLLGAGRPLISNLQTQMINNWFPPQERITAHGYLLVSMFFANFFGFFMPFYIAQQTLFEVQAIMISTLALPIIYLFKLAPQQQVSIQPSPILKQNRLIDIFFFAIQQASLKLFILTISPILNQRSYTQNDIGIFLSYVILLNMIVNLVIIQNKYLYFIFQSISIVYGLYAYQFINQRILIIINIGLFLQQQNTLNQIQNNFQKSLALFIGNIITIIIYTAYYFKNLNIDDLDIFQTAFAVLFGVRWLLQFCVNLKANNVSKVQINGIQFVENKYQQIQDSHHCY